MPVKTYTLICRGSGGDASTANWAAIRLTPTAIRDLRFFRELFAQTQDRTPNNSLYRLELHAPTHAAPSWYAMFDEAGENALALSAGWELKAAEQRLRVSDEADDVECEYLSVHEKGLVWSCRQQHSNEPDTETPMLTYADLDKMLAGTYTGETR